MHTDKIKDCIIKYGKSPKELSEYLQVNKLTITEYSRIIGANNSTVGKHFKKFGVTPYNLPRAVEKTFICKNCGESFTKVKRNQPQFNQYCSNNCAHNALKQEFQVSVFRFNTKDYQFEIPTENLGKYKFTGPRQYQFRNKQTCNHFFFKEGIKDEETAYVFGLMLSDGNVSQGKRESNKSLSICLMDHDIVEQISNIINYQKELKLIKNKYKELRIQSLYLFNDLVALGCVPSKSTVVNYPLVPDELDRHLIRGIIDGDGCWYETKNQTFLTICGNDKLIYGLYLKIKKHLNIEPSRLWYPIDHNDAKSYSFVKMLYCSRDSIIIRDWLYSNSKYYGERKYEKAYKELYSYKKQFTTTDLAKYLGVSADFIKTNQDKYPELPVNKTKGGNRYFKDKDIVQWVNFLKSRLKDPKTRLPNKEELILKWDVKN